MRYLLALTLVLGLSACEQQANEQAEQNVTTSTSSREQAQEQATAQHADIRGEEVSYQAGDTTLKGYIAYDANQQGKRPGVLVVHEWWGHNEYVRNRAHMLARMGYTALAVDMYGDGKSATHPEDAQKFMNEVMGNLEMMQARFAAAETLLREHSTTAPDQIAAIGYCFGGAVVLNMARQGADLDGVASFHGILSSPEPAAPGDIQAEVLVLHGADDPFVPTEQVDAFKQEMEAAKADYEFIAYPGAVHAFTNPGATALEQFLKRVFSEDRQLSAAKGG